MRKGGQENQVCLCLFVVYFCSLALSPLFSSPLFRSPDNINVYMCVYVHIYIYTHTCIYVCMYIYIYIYICVHVYIYIYIYTYVCVCTYIYIYTYIYTYTYTYTHIQLAPLYSIQGPRWPKPPSTFISPGVEGHPNSLPVEDSPGSRSRFPQTSMKGNRFFFVYILYYKL